MIILVLLPWGMILEKLFWRKKKPEIKIGTHSMGPLTLLGLAYIGLIAIEIVWAITNPYLETIINKGALYSEIIGMIFFGILGLISVPTLLFIRLKPQQQIRNLILYGLIVFDFMRDRDYHRI